MLTAVILAGGYSSRMNRNKMTMRLGEKEVIRRAVDTARKVCGKIIVVTGYYHHEIEDIFRGEAGITLIKNDRYDSGMFVSIKKGVSLVKSDFFILPGDYPLIKEETYECLAEAKGEIGVPVYRGRKGHPIYFKKELKNTLLKEPDESTLRNFRDKRKVEYIEVFDRGILIDIDTVEDFELVEKELREREGLE